MSTAQGYFRRTGAGTFEPTGHAQGAWRGDDLHLAPVTGLVIDQLERWRAEHAPGLAFGRITLEVLGQLPCAPIEVSTEVVRPGRTIELIETTVTIGGRTAILARAWLLQATDTAEAAGNDFDPMPPRDSCTQQSWLKKWSAGFIDTVQAVQSDDTRPGRAKVWITSEVDLIEGEEASALGEWAKLLDTANGISLRLDPHEWRYPNVELTLHLFGTPAGRWLGLDTRASAGPGGIGLTSSVVHDQDGPVGTLAQSLTLRRHLN